MKNLVILIGLIALTACGTTAQVRPEPIVVPQPIAVAVDAPCVPDTLGKPPVYVDSKAKLVAAADAAERMQLLYAGRAQRDARLNEIEPIIDGCPRGSVKKK